MFDAEVCRSLLFVPAGNARYLDSALRGAADVIQIDLEDAIAPDQKSAARACARQDVRQIAAADRVGAVRVNMDPVLLEQDLDAVVCADTAALTIPKVDSAATLTALDDQVAALEVDRGLPPGGIRLIAQIESAAGVLNAREIAQATPRLVAKERFGWLRRTRMCISMSLPRGQTPGVENPPLTPGAARTTL